MERRAAGTTRGFFALAAKIPENDVKRLMTKSGNRLQMVNAPGQETMVVATPNHNQLTLTEKSTGTSRPLVHLHSDGDIVLSAPNGRVHIQSQFFSREIGAAASHCARAGWF